MKKPRRRTIAIIILVGFVIWLLRRNIQLLLFDIIDDPFIIVRFGRGLGLTLLIVANIAILCKIVVLIIEGFRLLFYPKSQRKIFNAMLKGLMKNTKKPAPRFRVHRKLRHAINKRCSVGDIDKNLKYLLEHILVHMGLPKNSAKLHVIHSPFSSYSEGGAGQVGRYLGAECEIEFILTDDHKFWTIVAILAHECAHHLHHVKKFNMKVPNYEIFTDFTAMFYGFDKYLEKGSVITKTEHDRVYRAQFGYLKKESRDFLYCKWLLFKHRFLRR